MPVLSGALYSSSLPPEASPVHQGCADLGRQGARGLSRQLILGVPSIISTTLYEPIVGVHTPRFCPRSSSRTCCAVAANPPSAPPQNPLSARPRGHVATTSSAPSSTPRTPATTSASPSRNHAPHTMGSGSKHQGHHRSQPRPPTRSSPGRPRSLVGRVIVLAAPSTGTGPWPRSRSPFSLSCRLRLRGSGASPSSSSRASTPSWRTHLPLMSR
jgi:hypothetical protein